MKSANGKEWCRIKLHCVYYVVMLILGDFQPSMYIISKFYNNQSSVHVFLVAEWCYVLQNKPLHHKSTCSSLMFKVSVGLFITKSCVTRIQCWGVNSFNAISFQIRPNMFSCMSTPGPWLFYRHSRMSSDTMCQGGATATNYDTNAE